MSKEQLMSILKNGIERFVKQGKNYMRVSIDSDFADMTLHFYKFNDERSDLRSRHKQPKALDTDKQLRTKGAGTAAVVAHTLAILKRSIVIHPELYLPCEMELEVIEWDGVYYLEDRC